MSTAPLRSARFVVRLPATASVPIAFTASVAPVEPRARPTATERPVAATTDGSLAAALATATGGRPARLIVVAKAFVNRTDEYGDTEQHYRPKNRLDMQVEKGHSSARAPKAITVRRMHMGQEEQHRFTFHATPDHGHDSVLHEVHHNGSRIGRVATGGVHGPRGGGAAKLDASQHTHRHETRAMDAIHNMIHEHMHQNYAGTAKQPKMF